MFVLGLCCYVWAFCSCGYQDTFPCGPWASPYGGFSCCQAQALGAWALVLVAHGLSCSTACGTSQDQGLNPCPLHWQVYSDLLYHQGIPRPCYCLRWIVGREMKEGKQMTLIFPVFHPQWKRHPIRCACVVYSMSLGTVIWILKQLPIFRVSWNNFFIY